MASALYTDVKRKGQRSAFVRLGEGLFGLRAWLAPGGADALLPDVDAGTLGGAAEVAAAVRRARGEGRGARERGRAQERAPALARALSRPASPDPGLPSFLETVRGGGGGGNRSLGAGQGNVWGNSVLGKFLTHFSAFLFCRQLFHADVKSPPPARFGRAASGADHPLGAPASPPFEPPPSPGADLLALCGGAPLSTPPHWPLPWLDSPLAGDGWRPGSGGGGGRPPSAPRARPPSAPRVRDHHAGALRRRAWAAGNDVAALWTLVPVASPGAANGGHPHPSADTPAAAAMDAEASSLLDVLLHRRPKLAVPRPTSAGERMEATARRLASSLGAAHPHVGKAWLLAARAHGLGGAADAGAPAERALARYEGEEGGVGWRVGSLQTLSLTFLPSPSTARSTCAPTTWPPLSPRAPLRPPPPPRRRAARRRPTRAPTRRRPGRRARPNSNGGEEEEEGSVVAGGRRRLCGLGARRGRVTLCRRPSRLRTPRATITACLRAAPTTSRAPHLAPAHKKRPSWLPPTSPPASAPPPATTGPTFPTMALWWSVRPTAARRWRAGPPRGSPRRPPSPTSRPCSRPTSW